MCWAFLRSLRRSPGPAATDAKRCILTASFLRSQITDHRPTEGISVGRRLDYSKPVVTNGDSTAICHQPPTTPCHKSHSKHLSHDYRARNRGKPTISQCALGVDRSRLVALVEVARVALGGNELLLPNQLLTERAVPNAARVALPVKWAMHFPHDRNAARIFGAAA